MIASNKYFSVIKLAILTAASNRRIDLFYLFEILPDWKGERTCEKHEKLCQQDCVGSYCKAMSGTDGLRNNLP